MGLKHLKQKVETVKVGDGEGESFTVHGLSFQDISMLYGKYAMELATFFDLMARGNETGALDVDTAAILAADFIRKAPALAAETIAIGSGDADEEGFAIALSLPFPVQVDALKKIGTCTFGSEGSVKKFLQTVKLLMSAKTPSK